MVSGKQFVFIIGAPRSGSTWLHHTIALHPEVASTDAELTVFDSYVKPLVDAYVQEEVPIKLGKWNKGLAYIWNREEFDRFIKEFVNEIYASLNLLPQHKVILDKHPVYSFHVDLINYYFPEAKFIHVLRDGRDVASSFNRAYYKLGFGNPLFSGACFDWIRYKNAARKASKFGPKQYLEVRYENLMRDFPAELNKILSFCGLSVQVEITNDLILKNTGEGAMVSAPDKTVNYADRFSSKGLWKTRLSKEECYLSKKYLAEELINEGYETSSDWGLNRLEGMIVYISMKAKGIKRRTSRILGRIGVMSKK